MLTSRKSVPSVNVSRCEENTIIPLSIFCQCHNKTFGTADPKLPKQIDAVDQLDFTSQIKPVQCISCMSSLLSLGAVKQKRMHRTYFSVSAAFQQVNNIPISENKCKTNDVDQSSVPGQPSLWPFKLNLSRSGITFCLGLVNKDQLHIV